jgi:outer membrane protein assembly factor BamB
MKGGDEKMRKRNKKILLSGLVLIFLLSSTFVFVKAGEKQKKVEVKLIWKKEFPDGVRHVGSIGEFPGFEKEPDKAPPYPRTIITNKAIYFLSPKGEIEQEIPIADNQRVFSSENGKYILIMTIDKSLFGEGAWGLGTKELVYERSKEPKPGKFPKPPKIVENKARYKMINWKGEVLWENILPLYCHQSYCSMPLVSNKGTIIAFEGFWNQEFLSQLKYLSKDIYNMNFIDGKDGNIIKREKTGGYAECKFSRNGNVFVCALGNKLILYDGKTGSKLKEYNLAEFFGSSAVRFSKDNKYIILYVVLDLVKIKIKENKEVITIKSAKEKIERFIYIFDKSLNLLYKKSGFRSVGTISTSEDDRYLGIKEGNSISFLEIPTGKLLWGKKLPIISLDISSKGKFVIAGGKNYFVILNLNGEELNGNFSLEDTMVKVKISANGKFFVLQGERSIYLYEIQ